MAASAASDGNMSARQLEDLTDGWVDELNDVLPVIMIVAKEKGQSAQMRKKFDEILDRIEPGSYFMEWRIPWMESQWFM